MATSTAQKSSSAAQKSASGAPKSASAAHQGMTAPPSTAYKIVDIPEMYRDVIQRYGAPGTYVGPGEKDSPWVPFGANAAIRHLGFDPRHNIFMNMLWVKSAGVVGTHKHRGTVVMVCLEGSTRYLEYDWVAGPGSFIYETPGLTHTLVTDNPTGVKLFGWLQGPIEWYDEHGKFIETTDVFWFMNHYENYCREHNIPVNKQLYLT
jgi:2,4'-dihydroxyacetophenone dioxygenase